MNAHAGWHSGTTERVAGTQRACSSAEPQNRTKGHLRLTFALGYERGAAFLSVGPVCFDGPHGCFDGRWERNVREVKFLS